jgi:hypothetical protein
VNHIPIVHDSEHWPQIRLTQGFVALIDEESLPLVEQFTWFAARARSLVYAHHTAWNGQKNVTVRMHRLIAGALPGQVVDHINGCGIDNRRANLRICSMQENVWNQKKRKGSSKYRGVTLSNTGNRWNAMISVRRKLHYIGSYLTEDDAARAYDAVAAVEYGAFARLNFPEQP